MTRSRSRAAARRSAIASPRSRSASARSAASFSRSASRSRRNAARASASCRSRSATCWARASSSSPSWAASARRASPAGGSNGSATTTNSNRHGPTFTSSPSTRGHSACGVPLTSVSPGAHDRSSGPEVVSTIAQWTGSTPSPLSRTSHPSAEPMTVAGPRSGSRVPLRLPLRTTNSPAGSGSVGSDTAALPSTTE